LLSAALLFECQKIARCIHNLPQIRIAGTLNNRVEQLFGIIVQIRVGNRNPGNLF
jgi:hypothetical protein